MKQKHFSIKNIRKIASNAVFLVMIIGFAGLIYYLKPQIIASEVNTSEIKKPVIKVIAPTLAPVQTAVVAPIVEEIKKNPAKAPLKPTAKIVKPTTTINPDGGKKVIAGDAPSEIPQTLVARTINSDIASIKYIDQTGQNAGLETILKDFLSSKLKISTEQPSLYSITVQDAGASGWAGQYSYSYNINSSNQITSEIGLINLNTYYYKNDPYFIDYMKLVLSHEYGHHYTIYHKLMNWKLLSGTRFPDSYYTARNLSKTTTAIDYSKGWENCDAEIIAEDYSYIYSGYGYHGMSATYGYPPSPAIPIWLATDLISGPNAVANTDNPPIISITSPIANTEISGQMVIEASASDDKKVAKVAFFINDTLIIEDMVAPYEASINTLTRDNGNYILKATAFDDVGQSTSSTLSVGISNNQLDTIAPIVSIISPNTDPLNWSSGKLEIRASAVDNFQTVRIEIYTNDILRSRAYSDQINVNWPFDYDDPGTYNLKVKAYDKAGNVGEKTIVVIKI